MWYQENLRIISAFKGKSLKISMLLKWRNFLPFLPRSSEEELFLEQVSSRIKNGFHEDFHCQYEAVEVVSVSRRSHQHLELNQLKSESRDTAGNVPVAAANRKHPVIFFPCSFWPSKSSTPTIPLVPAILAFANVMRI